MVEDKAKTPVQQSRQIAEVLAVSPHIPSQEYGFVGAMRQQLQAAY